MDVWMYVVGCYACMYLYMYVCMYVCMYLYMYVCMYVFIYVCMHVCMYVFMYACIHVCMYVCMCMYARVYLLPNHKDAFLASESWPFTDSAGRLAGVEGDMHRPISRREKCAIQRLRPPLSLGTLQM